MRTAVASLLFIVALGCATDQKRVADGATAHYYLEALYERDCVAVVGPPSCAPARDALNNLRWEAQACAAALSQGKGHLPKTARKRLREATKAAEVVP